MSKGDKREHEDKSKRMANPNFDYLKKINDKSIVYRISLPKTLEIDPNILQWNAAVVE